MLLSSVHPGQFITFNPCDSSGYHTAALSASTIDTLIKHKHHTDCWKLLLKSAELLDDRELIDTLVKHGYGTTPYVPDPWILGYDCNIPRLGIGYEPERGQMLYILHNDRNWNRIDRVLASPKHMAGRGAVRGIFIASDILAYFNLDLGKPSRISYEADVSRLDIGLIEFIWNRLTNFHKRNQKYIKDVLSSNAAINNITMYRYILDYLIKDIGNHNLFQRPFIQAPTILQVRDNIKHYRRYSSTRLIVELFNPSNFTDTQSSTSQYHRLLVPLLEEDYKRYLSLLNKLGVFDPSSNSQCFIINQQQQQQQQQESIITSITNKFLKWFS
ncbi:hypothetical protein SAMD00019534_092950 [Acytostelium subglobosum LB1]|uniref:hypothetical protein n=1 Tax=Acytostelium subglobosum LB1 TaxID=1410327 RepID=UPI0006449AFD|nr:hypothetical protein SAMD00019534_092950 [Acytostelium subglobosum LB1]GAM26120.1 hypothetical protein SAMD00019534_092950 [Acytostelium subglobosum LB1]|eukprot:XP_012751163.1 hypothetical protein SAMD00019534_092950 [Acytostelium subglobosum LB1]